VKSVFESPVWKKGQEGSPGDGKKRMLNYRARPRAGGKKIIYRDRYNKK